MQIAVCLCPKVPFRKSRSRKSLDMAGRAVDLMELVHARLRPAEPRVLDFLSDCLPSDPRSRTQPAELLLQPFQTNAQVVDSTVKYRVDRNEIGSSAAIRGVCDGRSVLVDGLEVGRTLPISISYNTSTTSERFSMTGTSGHSNL